MPNSCIGTPCCVAGICGNIIELSDVILVEEDDTYSCECTGTGVPSEFPFTCPHGKVWSPYRCVSDRILVYPKPKPEKVGDLYLPEGNFVGGGTAKAMWEPQGTVIARGYGSYDQHTKKYSPYDVACGDEVVFTKNIPQGWFFELPGKDGKMYQVAYMGYADIHVKKG